MTVSTDSPPEKQHPSSSTKANPPLRSSRRVFFGVLLILIVAGAAYYAIRSTRDSGLGSGNTVELNKPGTEKAQHRDWSSIDDPANDGWDTEVFTNKAIKQLKMLGALLIDSGDIDHTTVVNLVTEDFSCGSLITSDLTTVFDNQHLKVDRTPSAPAGLKPLEQSPEKSELPNHGAGSLVEGLSHALDSLSGAKNLRFKFKVFRVIATPDQILTRQYFSISGNTNSGTVEQHATWDISWTPGTEEVSPRMRWLRVMEFEKVESRQQNGAIFADCTESVLGGNRSYSEQFLRGMNHWLDRIQTPSPFRFAGTPGLAVGDVNGDGLDDLYVCQEAGLPNRLFIQKSDGTAKDESASWGVNWLESSRSALLVDLDNDSDQDLVVAIHGGVVVAENDGKGKFRIRDVLPCGDDTMSLSAVDYDMDGKLDIYVCVYSENLRLTPNGNVAGLPGVTAGSSIHDANNGGSNSLFRNQISADSNWQFVNVTEKTGLNNNNQRQSLAAAWDDIDNDGDQDLYVANDYGRDNLYRNDSSPSSPPGAASQFVDISDSAHVEDSAAGMSITWGDYDRDGWMDAFVSNMWSSAGNRITFQDQFRPEAPVETKRRIQRLARGNTLLQNQGDGTFAHQSAPAGIEMGRWAWGSHFIDFNNDGWEDVIVSNGYITTEDTGDL